MRYAALEAAPLGITVNTVAPGLTDTPAVRGDLTK
jgi:NAD(P)-dependent dehydrogenase (short-subunit alcohol dehydrogenase family)